MNPQLWQLCHLVLSLLGASAVGVGQAWRVVPYAKVDYWDHPSWPRLDSSAFEVRTVSGVGRLVPLVPVDIAQKPQEPSGSPKTYPDNSEDLDQEQPSVDRSPNTSLEPEADQRDQESPGGSSWDYIPPQSFRSLSRARREAENETRMEQISSTKTVREVRQNQADSSWSAQPVSVEFRNRVGLDQIIQEQEDEEEVPGLSMASRASHHVPRADFVTSHYRGYDGRESRDMPVSRSYEEYEFPWYRNLVRDRDYEPGYYRRGFSYYYPDRYRTERDYYSREPSYYHQDRYRDDDLDLYGRSRPLPAPKPKRIIYYATLPEIVRKPVDLRNYPRGYDGLARTPTSRDGGYKRIPGNVDPSRYRYRHFYDGYDSYAKRSSYYDRPYNEDEARRRLKNEGEGEKKMSNQVRDEGKLPWPVQIGTEVSVKDDERIPGRKIYGENSGYERFQNGQLQKAPDATGSSELQSDN